MSQPSHPDETSAGLYQLALEQERTGDWAEAIRLYRQAVAQDRNFLEATFNLAVALHGQGQLDEAEPLYRKAIRLRPELAQAYLNLGGLLMDQGKPREARKFLLRGHAKAPDDAGILNNLALAYERDQDLANAEKYYRRAREADGGDPDIARNFGNLLRQTGRPSEARALFREAASATGDVSFRIREALALPPIPGSADEIAESRERFRSILKEVREGGGQIANPLTSVGVTSFYLAYHGENDRALQQTLAQTLLVAHPALGWTAPHCAAPKLPTARARRKVGVCSAFLVGDHTIGKLFRGVIAKLPRDAFEVVLIRPAGQTHAAANLVDAAADQVVRVPRDLAAARAAVAELELDVLLYPEIGMDVFTYFLAFARLAPVQCATWGHPNTSGIPNMDYFLSAEDWEPESNSDQYSEELARLSKLPLYYYHDDLTPPPYPGREELGLPVDRSLYAVTQSLFKVHPEFDRALARILDADGVAELVFIEADHPAWGELLRRRLGETLGGTMDRVRFLPRLSRREFFGLCRSADVLLDTPHFSGGNSSVEAFSLGAPVVTWPMGPARSRLTSYFYRQLGIAELAADDEDGYVDLATGIAGNGERRQALHEQLLERVDVLFENDGFVAGLAHFLATAEPRR